jgi:hypothetical protein
MIKMPISEIADRLSICRLKQERTPEDLREEIKLYENEVSNYVGIDRYIDQLYDINGEIWQLEADIRRGREKEIGLEEVGRRAVLIRGWNRQRIVVKNQIVEEFGEGFKDIKINHGSD